MVYLTYNDLPSGIYNSQVIDVVHYINTIPGKNIKLVALISIRGFFENRRKIKSACPKAFVLPMFPKAKFWKLNVITLYFFFLFYPVKKIIARGPFAANLALSIRQLGFVKKVVFDARGAYVAELTEYAVVKDASVTNAIHDIEKNALMKADFKIAVSDALVQYWKKTFGYTGSSHVVIPCTLSKAFEFELPPEQQLKALRQELGYTDNDIVFIYSGSSAGWQSFELVDAYMAKLMAANSRVKLIILSGHFDEHYEVMKQFRERVTVKWMKQEEVKNYLLASDYGILYREQSVTNEVASPVKFAEYISCGLKVLISEKLGDYSRFTKEHDCAFSEQDLRPLSHEDKTRIHALAALHFYKPVYRQQYLELVNI